MLLLCNETARRGSKRGAVVHKKDANGVQSKPLGLEYIVDRIEVDDPLSGYILRTEKEGWLQGFITVTTFMTWHRDFEWNSLAAENGITDVDKLEHAWDSDGALANALMSMPRQKPHPTREYAFLSPKVAEISLLGAMGCGAKLLQLVLDDLEQKGEYDYVVLQATDNAVSFYEKMGFVRIGAVAKPQQELLNGQPGKGSDRKSTKKALRESKSLEKNAAAQRAKQTTDDGWRKWCLMMLQHVLDMPEAALLMHARASPLMLERQRCVDLAGVADALRELSEDERHLYHTADRGVWANTVDLHSDPTAWVRHMHLPRYADAHDFCLDMRLVLEAMVRDPKVALKVKQASASVFQAFRQRWNSLGATEAIDAALLAASDTPSPGPTVLDDTLANVHDSRMFIYVDWEWSFFRGFKVYQVHDQTGETGIGSSSKQVREWTIAAELAPPEGFDPNFLVFVAREEKAYDYDFKPHVDSWGLLCDTHIEVCAHFSQGSLEGEECQRTQCLRIKDQAVVLTAAYTKLFALRALGNVTPNKAQLVPLASVRPPPKIATVAPPKLPAIPKLPALPKLTTPTGRSMYRCGVCGQPKVGHVCPGYRVAVVEAATPPPRLPDTQTSMPPCAAPPPPPPVPVLADHEDFANMLTLASLTSTPQPETAANQSAKEKLVCDQAHTPLATRPPATPLQATPLHATPPFATAAVLSHTEHGQDESALHHDLLEQQHARSEDVNMEHISLHMLQALPSETDATLQQEADTMHEERDKMHEKGDKIHEVGEKMQVEGESMREERGKMADRLQDAESLDSAPSAQQSLAGEHTHRLESAPALEEQAQMKQQSELETPDSLEPTPAKQEAVGDTVEGGDTGETLEVMAGSDAGRDAGIDAGIHVAGGVAKEEEIMPEEAVEEEEVIPQELKEEVDEQEQEVNFSNM